MARIRTIKPEFWTDEKVIRCSMPARLLFIGILNFCDDAANIEDSSLQLKVKIFPGDSFTISDIDAMVQEHVEVGLSARYEVQGRRYLHVVSFHKHQKPDHPTPPIYPLSPGQVYTYHRKNAHGKWDCHTVEASVANSERTVSGQGSDSERTGTGQGSDSQEGLGLGLGLDLEGQDQNQPPKPTAPDGAGVPASPVGGKPKTRRKPKRIHEFSDAAHRLLAYYCAEVRDDPSCKARALDWIDRRLEDGHAELELGDAIVQYAEQCDKESRPRDKRKNCANFFGEDRIYLGFPQRKAAAN